MATERWQRRAKHYAGCVWLRAVARLLYLSLRPLSIWASHVGTAITFLFLFGVISATAVIRLPSHVSVPILIGIVGALLLVAGTRLQLESIERETVRVEVLGVQAVKGAGIRVEVKNRGARTDVKAVLNDITGQPKRDRNLEFRWQQAAPIGALSRDQAKWVDLGRFLPPSGRQQFRFQPVDRNGVRHEAISPLDRSDEIVLDVLFLPSEGRETQCQVRITQGRGSRAGVQWRARPDQPWLGSVD